MKEKPYHHGNLRNELIEAGIRLINEEGLKSFSLRKVAARCQVSHTAPYSHFKDVDALISAMGEYVTEQFMHKLRSSIQGKEESRWAMALLGQAYIDFFIEHPPYFQFLYYYSGLTIDLDQAQPEDYPPFALFRSTAYGLFRKLGLPEEADSTNLISAWSMVHGIASLSTTSGIKYSGNWTEIFMATLAQKENPQ
ncbi:TetR/AcrR family transcriptional regulator [Paenibacillus sp. YN15]|uniref:TetR/AcrR family transcriptional regulator n=1 Tax=Paenibacillus sp. YN15 TaxID=1742774 RepID=UPI000DCE0C86|nr:TetR/AcrR family transcriptional regulator [Paenibacillus sp. YN15]RAU92588.1 TetR/AcrR family transcriptional regulator [Paenibacillus sp. YN15]